MQYAVQQTARHSFPLNDGTGRWRTTAMFTRLPAFNRAHADDMASALGERNVRSEWSHVRGESPTTYTYEVVCQARKSDGSSVWLSLSEMEMIASMFTDPVAMAAE